MSTANGGEPSPRTRRAVVSIAVAAVAIDAALLGLIAPLLPAIQERTGAGEGALGLALAAYAVPIALLALPLGRAADRIGRRLLLLGGLALVAAGSVFVAVSDSFGALIAARVVQGIGSASSWIAALALVSDSAPEGKRGQWLGVALGATSVGSIAGPALGGVAADVLSFEAPFLIFAGLAVALLIAAWLVLPWEAPRSRPAVPALSAIMRSVGSATGAWSATISLTSAGVLGLIEVVAPLDLDARLGVSSAAIGLLFAGSIAVDAALSPVGGRWGDRRGRLGPAITGLAAERPLGAAPRRPPRRRRDGDRARRLRGGVQPRVRRSGSLARRGLRGDRTRARLRRPEPALRRRVCDRSHHRRGAARARWRGSRLHPHRGGARRLHDRAGDRPAHARAPPGRLGSLSL